MDLSKDEIREKFEEWLIAWDHYDLDGVMQLIHDDIVFENWNGNIVTGKGSLRKAWIAWFLNRNFKFINEEIFIDVQEQKLLFRWCFDGSSLEPKFKGKHEIRRGIDVVHFLDGKINVKLSYSKTTIQIDSIPIFL